MFTTLQRDTVTITVQKMEIKLEEFSYNMFNFVLYFNFQ
jgi:hypothetical protein